MACELPLFDMGCIVNKNTLKQDEYVFEEDITGWLFELEFKTTPYATTAFSGTFVITDAPNGKVVREAIVIDANPNVYYADLTITYPSGEVTTWIRQKLTVQLTYDS